MREASAKPRLSKAPDEQLNVRIPSVLAAKLDQMVKTVDDHGGGRTPRKEIVAALLFATTQDGEVLVKLISRYRRASVDDVPRLDA